MRVNNVMQEKRFRNVYTNLGEKDKFFLEGKYLFINIVELLELGTGFFVTVINKPKKGLDLNLTAHFHKLETALRYSVSLIKNEKALYKGEYSQAWVKLYQGIQAHNVLIATKEWENINTYTGEIPTDKLKGTIGIVLYAGELKFLEGKKIKIDSTHFRILEEEG